MKRQPSVGTDLIRLAVTLAAVLLLLAAPFWSRWLPDPLAPNTWLLPVLALLGCMASVYLPLGGSSLALGTIVLPVVTLLYGAPWAGWTAAVILALRAGAHTLLLPGFRKVLRGSSLRSHLEMAGPVILASTVAAAVLQATGSAESWSAIRWSTWGMTIFVYLVVLLVASLVGRSRSALTSEFVSRLAMPAVLDVAGWLIGGLLAVRAMLELGIAVGFWLLLIVSLLAFEIGRVEHRRRLALERVRELQEVTLAGHRIIFQRPDLAGIAEQLVVELRRVVPLSWFHFELQDRGGRSRSWCAGRDGLIRDGVPEPPDRPPPLPGVHRQVGWKLLERRLQSDGEALGRLRLWIDPRRVEPTAIDLLDSLLPQVVSAVQRAVLDRRAKSDPLTGLADRGVLENRLELAFLRCQSEGGSVAVIMCDLDHFKQINDRFGHDAGDQALIGVTRIIRSHNREQDLCARYGGEEFAVVLEGVEGKAALLVAERLRVKVMNFPCEIDGTRIPLRISLGVAAYPELFVRSGKDLMTLADEALLESKRRGRNRVLLNLGRGRLLSARGRVLEGEDVQPDRKPPTLFA